MRAVDLFAGFGGFTCGAEMAGARVVWAANHWPLAVEAHRRNHPRTKHACQDLRQADWSTLPRFDLLLASPSCQGHSEAGQPARASSEVLRRRHDEMRATAWAVVDCADATEPRALVVENVPEFREWRLYSTWCEALRRIGYRLHQLVVRASDHGVPQRRRRLFVIGVRTLLPVRLRADGAEPAFGPCIEWDAGTWRPTSRATSNARRRFAAAQNNHGDRCLSQHVTNHPGVSLAEPIRTITTKDQWCVLDGDRYRPLTVRETARAMGFSDSETLPDVGRRDAIALLGNAVCPPVARDVVAATMEAA